MTNYLTDSCDNLLLSGEEQDDDDDYKEPQQLGRHEEELDNDDDDDDEEDALSALDNSSWGELDTAIARRPSASTSSLLSMNNARTSTTRSGGTKEQARNSSLLSNASLPEDHTSSFTKDDLSLNTCSTRDMSVSMIVDASSSRTSSFIGARSSFLDSMPDSTTASSLLTRTTAATTDWE